MKTLRRPAFLTLVLLLVAAPTLRAESALVGWQAAQPGLPTLVGNIRLIGPTARNHRPEPSGAFTGSFVPGTQAGEPARLAGVYLLSPDAKGELVARKIRFSVSPASNEPPVRAGKVGFETESVTFAPGDAFLLVFKAGKNSEMLMLPIVPLFIPS